MNVALRMVSCFDIRLQNTCPRQAGAGQAGQELSMTTDKASVRSIVRYMGSGLPSANKPPVRNCTVPMHFSELNQGVIRSA